MNTLILVGLSVAVLIAAVGRGATSQPQPPQIIYVVAQPEPARGAGCLPLLILGLVILLASIALR